MKYLFVWESVLSDYTEGMVCVFAKNEKEAWDLLKQDDCAWSKLRGNESYNIDDNRQPKELDKGCRPRKVTKSEAFVVWGGG